jgi:rhodanese-related sulfurtransferase
MTTAHPTAHSPSPVTAVPAASPEEAARHFATRLTLETDAADVAAALASGTPHFVLVDARSRAAYADAHIKGALSLPHAEITAQTVAALPEGLVVTYCWGPHCNGATRAAAKLAAHGRRVKEMLGGVDGWQKEGHALEGNV